MAMTISSILTQTEHRPWNLPKGAWSYYQEWNNAIFLHWKVDAAHLRKWVPETLELDTYEGEAWVSVVIFTMEGIRPSYLPSLSMISNFHELNVRTYVKNDGKTGVFFLSIEAANQLSCKIAFFLSGLPYRYSSMKRDNQNFVSNNPITKDSLSIKYALGNETNKDALDLWLTERYALFLIKENKTFIYEIHHIEWPIKQISIEALDIDYQRFISLINAAPQRVHYSKGVQVLAWPRIRLS